MLRMRLRAAESAKERFAQAIAFTALLAGTAALASPGAHGVGLTSARGPVAEAVQDLDLRGSEQDGRVDPGEPALALALGRTDGFDDDRVAHGTKLEHVLATGKRLGKTRKASWITQDGVVDSWLACHDN